MNGERSRGSLLDIAWLLLLLYCFASFLWRRDPAPPPPAPVTPWLAPVFQDEKWQPEPGPLRKPLDPHNQWERSKEEKRKGRGAP
jgi:hypothetical protein